MPSGEGSDREIRQTRILVVTVPQPLRAIVTDVVCAEDDFQVVGVLEVDVRLPEVVSLTKPDVVIQGLVDDRFPAEAQQLLAAHPRLRILGVTRDGARAHLLELRPHHATLGEASVSGLVRAIRGEPVET